MSFSSLAVLLTAQSITGKPSISQWVLVFVFMSSGLVLCGYAGGLWRATLKGAKRLNEGLQIRASGQMEKPSMYPDTLAGRAVSRAQKAAISLVLVAIGWILHSGVQARTYAQEYAAWKQRSAEYQKAYAAWSLTQTKEK